MDVTAVWLDEMDKNGELDRCSGIRQPIKREPRLTLCVKCVQLTVWTGWFLCRAGSDGPVSGHTQ